MNTDQTPKIELPEGYTNSALDLMRKALKGNGVRADSVTIKNFDGSMLEFTAATHAKLHHKISEKKSPGKAAGDTIFPNTQAAYKAAESYAASIFQQPAVIKQIKNTISQKPHGGFALDNQSIKLTALNRDFVSHDQCSPCHGKGQTQCAKCKGKGFEPCFHCNAQGFERCNECNGNRQIRGPQGQMQTCNLCQGLGKTSCSFCRENRQIQCSICKTKGEAPCKVCGGQGAQSNILSAELSAQCTYDFDANTIPEKAAALIRNMGASLTQHATITPISKDEAEQDEDTIHLFYNVQTPQGEIEFSVKDKSINAYLFGTQSTIKEIPDFLDSILSPGIKKLSQAASGQGSTAENMQAATKYKTIKQAVMLCARYNAKKALKALMHYTPLGLSTNAAQSLISEANAALNNATKQQRIIAMVIGALGGLALSAAYFLTPANQILLAKIRNASMHLPLQMIVLGGCVMCGYAIWHVISSNARKQALKNMVAKK